MESALVLLSIVVFLPALGALLVAFVPRDQPDLMKLTTLGVTVAVFLLTVWMAIPAGETCGLRFSLGVPEMQGAFSVPWIPYFNIYYALGFDGISFPLVILTTFLGVLAMGASWSINKYVKAYCILFLLLETGVLGVFLSLDFFLFYVFWEVMLLPMYFLIGVWGGPRKEYAAIKFFLYTLIGGVLMLIALLMLYFGSDLLALARVSDLVSDAAPVSWDALHLHPSVTQSVRAALESGSSEKIHTFNLLAMAQMGQHTALFSDNLQWWAFLLLLIGFVIKVPSVPVHTWLPDAHVEAPTPISMILAGILLKLGGYGIIRICYPICPSGGYALAWLVVGLGVVSMVYGALAAMAQKDFKRLVAYSSVSHMGYVVLGFGVWSATSDVVPHYNPEYWQLGMNGAMFQMIAHGISSAGMFFLVGVVYDRVHHRNLDEFGGLFGRMPLYAAFSIGIFFAGLGLPGLCGFIGEVFVTLSVWNYSQILAVISASVVVLTAGYILWTIQRVYLGAEYKGPHPEALVPMNLREISIAAPLLVLAILLGVFPRQTLLTYMTPSVNQTVEQLAEWTARADAARAQAPVEETAASSVRPLSLVRPSSGLPAAGVPLAAEWQLEGGPAPIDGGFLPGGLVP